MAARRAFCILRRESCACSEGCAVPSGARRKGTMELAADASRCNMREEEKASSATLGITAQSGSDERSWELAVLVRCGSAACAWPSIPGSAAESAWAAALFGPSPGGSRCGFESTVLSTDINFWMCGGSMWWSADLDRDPTAWSSPLLERILSTASSRRSCRKSSSSTSFVVAWRARVKEELRLGLALRQRSRAETAGRLRFMVDFDRVTVGRGTNDGRATWAKAQTTCRVVATTRSVSADDFLLNPGITAGDCL
mmetsp:Transcript_17310/g.41722  ORF Transcript_17310/g.41722 Transcript_17310/m.41722 type:complete len:255 (+) Transcript_17310:225-989(+)